MNRKIETLDDLTINKIAAGEVVEAPCSVVKELVENSIDAGASAITLEIREGGKKYIRVTDNGVGIAEEYVEQAFMRHSTSKITNIDDLGNISSLGFRGEALASIAAVSGIEMVTRTKEQKYGTLIKIVGGEIVAIKKTGCPIGTTVIVKNLFFNTPVRLKFMKSNSTETMKISRTITRLSLSNSGISFKYINNNSIVFVTPGNKKLSEAILCVLNKETFKNLIYIEEEELNMKLQGYIGQPNFVRGNRNLQIVYVNGRYVKSKLLGRAIEEAYKEKIIINKYPICVLNLTIDPSEIDINVHPSKIEIKFEKEEQIQEFVYSSIVKTLEKNTTIPRLSVTEPKFRDSQKPNSMPTTRTKIGDLEDTGEGGNITENILANEISEDYIQKSGVRRTNSFIDNQNNDNRERTRVSDISEDILQSSFLDILSDQYKIIGQIFDTYIILEKGQSVYLIDQHAAHERLLYNKFLKEIKDERVVSQRLAEPRVLELSNEDYILLSDNINLFVKLGFHIEDFGTGAVIIREVPMVLGEPRNFSFIYEILDGIGNSDSITDYFEDTIIQRACKKAIKARDRLDYYEIEQLIEELLTLTPPLTCPHGRPIILTMRQYDIEKHFKRIQ